MDGKTAGSFRWTEESTLLLVNLVKEKNAHLLQCKSKRVTWEAIAEEMTANGYLVAWEEVSRKYASLLTTYKRAIERKYTKWPYYELFDEMLGDKFHDEPHVVRVLSSRSSTKRKFKNDNRNDSSASDEESIASSSPTFPLNSEANLTLPPYSKGSFKWSDQTIMLLLTLVNDKKAYWPLQSKKKRIKWEAIAEAMALKGYSLSWEDVSRKWGGLLNTYKRIIERMYTEGRSTTKWPYYDMFDEMLGSKLNVPSKTGVLSSSNGPNHTVLEISGPSAYSSNPSEDESIASSGITSSFEDETPKMNVSWTEGFGNRKRARLAEEAVMLPAHEAPPWFLEYCERKERSEQQWRQGFTAIMEERTNAIRSLTDVISRLITSLGK